MEPPKVPKMAPSAPTKVPAAKKDVDLDAGELSNREKRKLDRKSYSLGRQPVHDQRGFLDGRDLCDCLDNSCPGCFYPCPNCSSEKCGHVCRQNRKWSYDSVHVEGDNRSQERQE